ncbi:hypothetical protein M3Y98_00696100 [Aphelenchoides besseyi]|nr:hypothetical protein M3Y98_00696100 [Aphelenchoides besseyi]
MHRYTWRCVIEAILPTFSETLFNTSVTRAYQSTHEDFLSLEAEAEVQIVGIKYTRRTDQFWAKVNDRYGFVYKGFVDPVAYVFFLEESLKTNRKFFRVEHRDKSNTPIANQVVDEIESQSEFLRDYEVNANAAEIPINETLLNTLKLKAAEQEAAQHSHSHSHSHGHSHDHSHEHSHNHPHDHPKGAITSTLSPPEDRGLNPWTYAPLNLDAKEESKSAESIVESSTQQPQQTVESTTLPLPPELTVEKEKPSVQQVKEEVPSDPTLTMTLTPLQESTSTAPPTVHQQSVPAEPIVQPVDLPVPEVQQPSVTQTPPETVQQPVVTVEPPQHQESTQPPAKALPPVQQPSAISDPVIEQIQHPPEPIHQSVPVHQHAEPTTTLSPPVELQPPMQQFDSVITQPSIPPVDQEVTPQPPVDLTPVQEPTITVPSPIQQSSVTSEPVIEQSPTNRVQQTRVLGSFMQTLRSQLPFLDMLDDTGIVVSTYFIVAICTWLVSFLLNDQKSADALDKRTLYESQTRCKELQCEIEQLQRERQTPQQLAEIKALRSEHAKQQTMIQQLRAQLIDPHTLKAKDDQIRELEKRLRDVGTELTQKNEIWSPIKKRRPKKRKATEARRTVPGGWSEVGAGLDNIDEPSKKWSKAEIEELAAARGELRRVEAERDQLKHDLQKAESELENLRERARETQQLRAKLEQRDEQVAEMLQMIKEKDQKLTDSAGLREEVYRLDALRERNETTAKDLEKRLQRAEETEQKLRNKWFHDERAMNARIRTLEETIDKLRSFDPLNASSPCNFAVTQDVVPDLWSPFNPHASVVNEDASFEDSDVSRQEPRRRSQRATAVSPGRSSLGGPRLLPRNESFVSTGSRGEAGSRDGGKRSSLTGRSMMDVSHEDIQQPRGTQGRRMRSRSAGRHSAVDQSGRHSATTLLLQQRVPSASRLHKTNPLFGDFSSDDQKSPPPQLVDTSGIPPPNLRRPTAAPLGVRLHKPRPS